MIVQRKKKSKNSSFHHRHPSFPQFSKIQYLGATLRVGLSVTMPYSGSLLTGSLPIAGAASGISATIPCALSPYWIYSAPKIWEPPRGAVSECAFGPHAALAACACTHLSATGRRRQAKKSEMLMYNSTLRFQNFSPPCLRTKFIILHSPYRGATTGRRRQGAVSESSPPSPFPLFKGSKGGPGRGLSFMWAKGCYRTEYIGFSGAF